MSWETVRTVPIKEYLLNVLHPARIELKELKARAIKTTTIGIFQESKGGLHKMQVQINKDLKSIRADLE